MNDGGVNERFDLEEQQDEQEKCKLNIFKFDILSLSIHFVAMVIAIISISQILVFKTSHYREMENIDKNNKNNCEKNETLPFNIVQQVLKLYDTQRRIKDKSTVDSSPVTAHKCIGTSQSTQFPDFKNNHIVVPLNTTNLSPCDHHRGVTVTSEGFVLQYDGLYYIYSSIKFRTFLDNNSRDFPYQTWFHYVNRESPNHPMNTGVLLRSVHTCCPSCNRSAETSYTGGIFFINANDKLRITLSGEGLAEVNDQSSYFGIFMLASKRP